MPDHLGWYGIAVGSILILKLLLSVRKRGGSPLKFRDTPNHYVHGVITVHNEEPELLEKCLISLINQTRKPNSITIVDDCSATKDVEKLVYRYFPIFDACDIEIDFIRFEENRGKRHGLVTGFNMKPDAEVYLCIDSDTVLDSNAVAEAMKPFSKRRVNCVTGLVLALNRTDNLLTRLIDMRYMNAFLCDRVAYSRLGSVLCACGSLVLYRGAAIRPYLDDFLSQEFLGKEVTFGDDRRLTYYCLLNGQSVIQPSAVAWTDVPAELPKFLKQQTRWTKSFIREGTLLFLQFRKMNRAFWWLNLVELVTWTLFTSALVVAMVVFTTHPSMWSVFMWYAIYVCSASWLRSLHYLRSEGRIPKRERVQTFLAAPVYALMNLTLLIPLRLWAICTLRNNAWGTRMSGQNPTRCATVETPLPIFNSEDTMTIVVQDAPTMEFAAIREDQ